MQEVTYSTGLRETPQLFALAQLTTKQMDEELGENAARVVARWDRVEDAGGRSLLRLEMREEEDAAARTFAPDELTDERDRGFRLRRLRDDVLRIRSHRVLKSLREERELGA